MITIHQRLFAILSSSMLLFIIFAFVYKRKIKEEYSWLWIMTGVIIFLLVIFNNVLLFITRAIGAVSSLNTLFIFAFIFLIFINIHFSIKISTFSEQIKELAQQLAIFTKDVDILGKKMKN